MTQLALAMRPPPGDSIQAAFEEFHRRNPWVASRLIAMTRDLRARGRERVGMKMLFEVLRWEVWMRTDDPRSDFKLNNNYHSRYARLIMDSCPDLADAFETRELRAE